MAPSAFELAAAVLIGRGCWLIYEPVAWLWAGVACFALSYMIESGPTGPPQVHGHRTTHREDKR